MYLDPPIKKFPVTPEDAAMAVYCGSERCLLHHDEIRPGSGRNDVCDFRETETFQQPAADGNLESRLKKEHPHFMRTSKFYLVNLTKIRGLKVPAARDLWFDGIKNQWWNAVTSTYLADFEKKLTWALNCSQVSTGFWAGGSIRTTTDELIPLQEIIYIYSSGGTFAVRAGKDDAELAGSLNTWAKQLRGLFMQTHRRYLVALDRIGNFWAFSAGGWKIQPADR